MGERDIGEEGEQVCDGELERDAGARVAARDQALVVVVLLEELVLHRVPHHLRTGRSAGQRGAVGVRGAKVDRVGSGYDRSRGLVVAIQHGALR